MQFDSNAAPQIDYAARTFPSTRSSTSSTIRNRDSMGHRGKCLYPSRWCDNERALKRNGKAHNLCELHRRKQNEHQRKFDSKKARSLPGQERSKYVSSSKTATTSRHPSQSIQLTTTLGHNPSPSTTNLPRLEMLCAHFEKERCDRIPVVPSTQASMRSVPFFCEQSEGYFGGYYLRYKQDQQIWKRRILPSIDVRIGLNTHSYEASRFTSFERSLRNSIAFRH
uniref:Uncharacterized protein AlNc14C209G8880 n=1 Tax=Albugo laibachii Nc14 TaxID=890382 RepID=F0WR73_9STRA|nr:conserved hypothetical protein [Albugo laibachii Nc14]|eukprot:CCA23834.1 conserved hypothetical protein [Albugo laibachii Nc14]